MKNRLSYHLLFGVFVVLTGLVLLLLNIGVLPALWRPVFISYRALLFVLGLFCFFRGRFFWGIILCVMSVYLLMSELSIAIGFNYSRESIDSIFWPVFVIVIGLCLIINHHRKCHFHFHRHLCSRGVEGVIDYNLLMNGVDEIFLGPVFRGGEINAIMGGIKLDLRKTSLPEGDTVLKLNTIFGGATFKIPEEWLVEIHNTSFLGGFADKRPISSTSSDRKLIIEVNSIMGGGEIEC